MSEEKKVEEIISIVSELPVQQYDEFTTEDGKKVKLITVNQAITEMYNDIKEIKKSVA